MDPEAISAEKTGDYMIEWAQSIFGTEYAKDIADIVSKYTKYNLLRKAEVQLPDVFSVVNYHEADRILAAWKELTAKAEELEHKLSPEAKDAYYQLVLYPVKASAGVAEIYLSVGKIVCMRNKDASAPTIMPHARKNYSILTGI